MIVGRNYRIDSNRNDLSLRPDGSGDGSVLKGYVLGSDITNFSFRLEEVEGGIYQLRHNATGLYLEYVSGQIQLKTREVGRIEQSFLIEDDQSGSNRGKSIRYQGLFDTYFKLTADADGTTVETSAFASGNDSFFTLVEIVLSNLAPPTVDKIFFDDVSTTVTAVQPNATVTAFVDGNGYTPQTNDNDNEITMALPALQVGNSIQFRQSVNGQTSGLSAAVKVNRLARVHEEGAMFRAYWGIVTDSTGNNPNNWIATKGAPIDVARATLAEAVADITRAGYTSQTYTQS